MADVKISQLPAATTPLAGSEQIPLVQSGATKQVTVNGLFTSANLGTPSAISLTNATNVPVDQATGVLPVNHGGTGTTTPSIVAGTNVTVTGTWPNQTINSTAGSVTGVTATAPVVSSGGTTPDISMAAATTSANGYLTSTDWNTFNSKLASGGPLGTPSSGTATNLTGLPLTTGVTGTLPVANGGSGATTLTGIVKGNGTSAFTAATAGTDYVAPGGALGTPSSGTATNLTGLPLSTGVTGLLPVANGGTGTATPALVAGTNVTITGTWPNQTINSTGGGGGSMVYPGAGIPNSTGSAWSTSYSTTGTGTVVALATSPTFVTPALGTPSSGTMTNVTGLPLTSGVTGTLPVANGGTGVTTSTGSGSTVLSTTPTLVTPILGTPTSVTLTNATGLPLSTGVTGTLGIANGGTGQTTAAAAITALTGTQTSAYYLRSNGTNASLSALSAADLTGTVAVASGGSGQTTAQAAMNTFAGATTSGSYLRGNGTNVVMSTIQAADVPTLNQNTTGTAAGLSATLAIASGGTGATTLAGASIVTYTGTETLSNKTLTNPTVTNYVETLYTANTGTAITVSLTNGTVQQLTLTGNATITMPTAVAGKSFIIMLKQDATGSRSVTWTTVVWPSGTAPTITGTASKQDIYSFFSDGTNWYGTTVGQDY